MINTPNGRTPIKQFKVGDPVISRLNNKLVIRKTTRVMKRWAPIEELVIINLEDFNKPVISTMEHPFIVKGKEVPAAMLNYGDEIPHLDGRTTLSFLQKGKRNSIHKMSKETKQKMRELTKKTFKGVPKSKAHRKKISEAKLKNPTKLYGPDNPNWQGGVNEKRYYYWSNRAEWRRIRKKIFKRDNYTCQNPKCGSKEKLTVHHIDYDVYNNSFDNLITLCSRCNSSICHGRSTMGVDNWEELLSGLVVENGIMVESVEPISKKQCARLGEGHRGQGGSGEGAWVYNLEIEESHNYFAHSLLTHNCDQSHYTEVMKQDVVSAVTKYINKMEVQNVHFFGGEPLFYPPAVKQILAETSVPTYQITTNGTIMTRDLFDWLKYHNVKVALSFDGTKEMQDKYRDNSYDRVIQNLPYLKQLTSNVLMTMANMHTAYDQVSAIKDLGFRGVFMNILHPHGFGYDEDQLKIMEGEYRRIIKDFHKPPSFQIYDLGKMYQVALSRIRGFKGACGYVRRGVGCDVDGKLYACHRGMELGEDFSIGDVWNGIDLKKEKEVRAAGEKLPEKCKNCAMGCLPCPVNSYKSKGVFGAEPDDYWCEAIKIRYKVAMELGPKYYPSMAKKMGVNRSNPSDAHKPLSIEVKRKPDDSL